MRRDFAIVLESARFTRLTNKSGWSVVVGEKPEADSRDEVRHTERNGQ